MRYHSAVGFLSYSLLIINKASGFGVGSSRPSNNHVQQQKSPLFLNPQQHVRTEYKYSSPATTSSSSLLKSSSSSTNNDEEEERIDFTMVGIDDNNGFNAFDPTSGDSPAVSRNNKGEVWVKQRARPRRNRKSVAMRNMVRENIITPSNFIYPLFIHEDGPDNVSIESMPGCERHTLSSMINEIRDAWQYGIRTFILFPKVPDEFKTNLASECYNPEGIVPRALRMIKEEFPDSILCTDVALDPYSNQGHDGAVQDGKILNDVTITQLCKQVVCQARAGADVVAPSDMMDGRVGAIRDALDSEGFTDVSILAYTAKYASAYYGPFRDALDSHPGFGDKKTYQQDPANGAEALIEAQLDEAEGADMLMVKPGMPYLDVIRRLKDASNLPIAAYHVSGEYAMIKAACERGWLDEKDVVLETLTCFKRAGADIILTYYAKQAAKWLCEDGLF